MIMNVWRRILGCIFGWVGMALVVGVPTLESISSRLWCYYLEFLSAMFFFLQTGESIDISFALYSRSRVPSFNISILG